MAKQVQSEAVQESAPLRAAFAADCLVLLRLILTEEDLDARKMAVLRAVAERAFGIDDRAFAILSPALAKLGTREAANARATLRARPEAERIQLGCSVLAHALRDESLTPYAKRMRLRTAAILDIPDADMSKC